MKTRNPRIGVILDPWEYSSFIPKHILQKLEEISDDIHFAEASSFQGEDEWKAWLKEIRPEIILTGWMTPSLPEDCLKEIPELNYMCHLVGSVKGTVSDDLIAEGLIVTNWGHSISRTVAECGLMLAIGALRRASFWTLEMHNRAGWKDRKKVETGSLFGRRVGLHGFGAISQELRRLLVPFDCPVSTFSPSVPDALLAEHDVLRADTLEDLFSKNDVIFELAALTPKNRGIVTEELLRMIEHGGAFVNIGRGAVVDEVALAKVAAEGNIQVALDVFGEEPLPADSPFRKLDQVFTLPHLGGPTIDRRQDATLHGIRNIHRYLAGEPMMDQITAEVSKRIS
ncbi:hydroxyacid dehydrogenase [Puniceicoccales bacterium CK1056]|uniref:Hydroxyacid dehydrogenase n=1 Tax=Oceanipulchritudo coccoides TaxID=2706888 RepID=A0A6B2M2A2_9BACT|nr:hydroxyacid dehydrogenase [Oceanipulchritudo coccoides]NDV62264.1 hydroxyacid dehydrogenase [Oceanipulchritudo coccoides]